MPGSTHHRATQTRSLRSTKLVGWRSWVVSPARLPEHATSAVLRGPRGKLWVGPKASAACLYMDSVLSEAVGGEGKWGRHPGPAPDVSCRCGIHAMKVEAIEHLNPIRGNPTVSGFVTLSGVVIEGTYGFRAQHAEMAAPLEIQVLCSHDGCNRPADGVAEDPRRYVGHCWDHVVDPAEMIETEAWLDDVVEVLEKRYLAPIVAIGRGETT